MSQTPVPGMKFDIGIWVGLLVIVALEVVLTYQHLPTHTLLATLLGLAFLEAAIGVTYFMHLKYENARLFWSLIPILLFVLLMMDHVWADAFRMYSLRLLHQ